MLGPIPWNQCFTCNESCWSKLFLFASAPFCLSSFEGAWFLFWYSPPVPVLFFNLFQQPSYLRCLNRVATSLNSDSGNFSTDNSLTKLCGKNERFSGKQLCLIPSAQQASPLTPPLIITLHLEDSHWLSFKMLFKRYYRKEPYSLHKATAFTLVSLRFERRLIMMRLIHLNRGVYRSDEPIW